MAAGVRKVFLVLATLIACSTLACSQPPVPTPSELNGPSQEKTASESQETNSHQRITQERPPILGVHGASVVEEHGGPKQQQKPRKANKEEIEEPATYWGFTAEDWTAISTGILALVGLATAIVFIWQAILLRSQIKLAREEFSTTLRAFVSVDGFDTILFTREDTEGPGEYDFGESQEPGPRKLENRLVPTYFSIQPRWRNAGSTPTKNMTTNVHWKAMTLSEESRPIEFTYKDGAERHFLGPMAIETSAHIQIPVVYARNFIKFQCGMPSIATVGSNEYATTFPWIVVWGRADYSDIFGYPHFIEWCYRIGFACPDGKKLTATFTQYGDYNRTDHDTQKRPERSKTRLRFWLR